MTVAENDGSVCLRVAPCCGTALYDFSVTNGVQLHQGEQTPSFLIRFVRLISKFMEQRSSSANSPLGKHQLWLCFQFRTPHLVVWYIEAAYACSVGQHIDRS